MDFKLPWLSVPESEFPPRVPRRRRKRKTAEPSSKEVELPTRSQEESTGTSDELPVSEPAAPESLPLEQMASEPDRTTSMVDEGTTSSPIPESVVASVQTEIPSADSAIPTPVAPGSATSPAPAHKRNATRPVIPAVPIVPVNKAPLPRSSVASPAAGIKSPVETSATHEPVVGTSSPTVNEEALPPPSPVKQPPKSWAELLRTKGPAPNGTAGGTPPAPDTPVNGILVPKVTSLADLLRSYDADSWGKISFLEPRGLINTGNMCYMNSVRKNRG